MIQEVQTWAWWTRNEPGRIADCFYWKSGQYAQVCAWVNRADRPSFAGLKQSRFALLLYTRIRLFTSSLYDIPPHLVTHLTSPHIRPKIYHSLTTTKRNVNVAIISPDPYQD
jgi:hypothetical protein